MVKRRKIYFIYKFANNPNSEDTCRKLEKLFGKGYVFGREHPNIENKSTRGKIRRLFTRDMRDGGFDIVIVDISYGYGRFMKEEIALAKKLKIPIKKINLLKTRKSIN